MGFIMGNKLARTVFFSPFIFLFFFFKALIRKEGGREGGCNHILLRI